MSGSLPPSVPLCVSLRAIAYLIVLNIMTAAKVGTKWKERQKAHCQWHSHTRSVRRYESHKDKSSINSAPVERPVTVRLSACELLQGAHLHLYCCHQHGKRPLVNVFGELQKEKLPADNRGITLWKSTEGNWWESAAAASTGRLHETQVKGTESVSSKPVYGVRALFWVTNFGRWQ